jgi:hypothetical protein
MKTTVLILTLVLLAAAPVGAADLSTTVEDAVRATQERKMGSVAGIVALGADQKADFDGLYEEYQRGLVALNEQYASLTWRLLEKSSVPTVEETKKLMREFRDLEVKKLDLREYYFEKLGKILEPAQFIRLLQLENKADAILKHSVATRIPFLE